MGIKNEDMGIKEYIKKNPKVTEFLNEMKLPCETCKNNCMLKNIPEMESYSLEKEIYFMEKLSELDEK